MKNKYDGLLFDMDGVLVDVTNSYRIAIQKTASYFLKREVKISDVNEIKKKVGMNNDWDATFALINDKEIPYKEVKAVFQKMYWGEGTKRGLINNEQLLVKKNELIKLKDKYGKLGIATGRPRKEAEYVLERFGLWEIFEVMIGKEDTNKEKPFPDPLLRAMEDMGTNNVIYIGDSPSDVTAAKAANIPCIFVGELNRGTLCFQTMSQVVDYLL